MFKVLSDEEICTMFNFGAKYIAKEALKDTLRQVLEMLDGIEKKNPYLRIPFWHDKAKGYDEAIQTIKQAIKQAIEEAVNE